MPRDTTKLPTWNLTDLFSGEDDPKLNRAISRAKRQAELFAKKYRGTLARKIKRAADLVTILRQYESIFCDAAKPVIYASLRFSETSTAPGRGAFLQKMRAENVGISQLLLFFELELSALPERRLRALSREPALAAYRNYLLKLIVRRKHLLSEESEKLLADFELTGRGAFERLFNEEFAAKRFIYRLGNQSKELREEELLELLYSTKRKERKAGAKALSDGLRQDIRRLTFISNILIENKATEDRYRQFATPEEPRHLANEIRQEMVDAMTEAVQEYYPVVQKFYRFKAKLMGLTELYDYDRYAPIGKSKSIISYPKARDTILAAFDRFSPQYGDVARRFFDDSWIDAAPRPGKRGGGFCAFVTPDVHPYIFVNYSAGYKEMFTLAHELGHGVHAYLMRKQNYLNFDVPLTIAETASVFAEMLLFDHLKTTTPTKELLPLYVKKIEGIFATVFRQISMYRFEQDFHAARRKEGELAPEKVGQIWRTQQQKLYGKSVTLTEDYNLWWSYIPHFIHTPFYVYAYAFGELLTLSLYGLYLTQGKTFVADYFEMLSTGGSKPPEELLKPFGVNLADKNFWKQGLAVIERMTEEVRRL